MAQRLVVLHKRQPRTRRWRRLLLCRRAHSRSCDCDVIRPRTTKHKRLYSLTGVASVAQLRRSHSGLRCKLGWRVFATNVSSGARTPHPATLRERGKILSIPDARDADTSQVLGSTVVVRPSACGAFWKCLGVLERTCSCQGSSGANQKLTMLISSFT